MNLVETYGNIIKKYAPAHPTAAFRMIKAGLYLERFRTKHLADKKIPGAYRYLNTYAVDYVLQALRHPQSTVWANIFAPVEILQCFDLRCLSVECLSSFLSGFRIEDYFLDFAEEEGIASTLCSYHKTFIGASDSGIVPPAAFSLTTSTICDGNINTFRYLSENCGVDNFLLDIPMDNSEEAIEYVIAQLKDLISTLEKTFHKSFSPARLTEVIKRENASKELYEKCLVLLRDKAYPSTLTLQMYMLFATHLNIGEPEILTFFEKMHEELLAAPAFDGINILWVHLLPWYQETLQEYFNLTDDCQIQAIEMNLDYRQPLDPDDPLRSLALKMINNAYTRSYDRKVDLVCDLADELQPDGVINFCHWGCKQSSGGVMRLKERMQEKDLPLLILDGDGMDRRNSHNEQIRTRWEAFHELLKTRKGQ